VKYGRISVSASNVPLHALLDEISRQARVAVVTGDAVGAERVSVQFEGLALDQGLRRILSGYDAFFFYGSDPRANSPASLRVIWVYPKGGGNGLEPVPPSQWASTRELVSQLSASDPKVRARAIEHLIERGHGAARDQVVKALRDPDDSVRSRALYGAQTYGVAISPDSLKEMLANDSSPEVRFIALDWLGSGPDAEAAAEQALNDSDVHVRKRAREILDRLGAKKRPPQPPPAAEQSEPNKGSGSAEQPQSEADQ
jgi:HEAT repeats